MRQNTQQTEEEFYQNYIRLQIQNQLEAYSIVLTLLEDVIAAALKQIEFKDFLKVLPIYSTQQAHKLSKNVIDKNLMQCKPLDKAKFQIMDIQPKVTVKQVWLTGSTRITPAIRTRVNSINTQYRRFSIIGSFKKSDSSNSNKNPINNYNFTLNLENARDDNENEDVFRHRKRRDELKLLGDHKKKRFRNGIKFLEDENELQSFKTKDKKSGKFVYDDQGQKIFTHIVDKIHPLEDPNVLFQYDKNRGIETVKKRLQRSNASKSILKPKQKLNLGQSIFEMMRIDNSPFAQNFVQKQKSNFPSPREKSQQKNKQRRSSFNLFKQTQSFLNKQLKLSQNDNVCQDMPNLRHFSYINNEAKPIKFLQTHTILDRNKSKITIFNDQLLKKINRAQIEYKDQSRNYSTFGSRFKTSVTRI